MLTATRSRPPRPGLDSKRWFLMSSTKLLSQSWLPCCAMPRTSPSMKPAPFMVAGEKKVSLICSSSLRVRVTELNLSGTMLWPNLGDSSYRIPFRKSVLIKIGLPRSIDKYLWSWSRNNTKPILRLT